MRTTVLATLFAAMIALPIGLSPHTSAESPTPSPKSAEKPSDWKDDPTCRMVFFAVLEGLYTDGVPDEVVNAIVPRSPKAGMNPVKTSFVVQCPLCHPVYEAFALYQHRPAFSAGDGDRNTFGSGIGADLEKSLTSPVPRTRLTALRALVQRWVERRLTAMRLTEAEKKQWAKKLNERSNQGRAFLSSLLGSDPDYKGWSIYWGCAACGGTTAACQAVKPIGME